MLRTACTQHYISWLQIFVQAIVLTRFDALLSLFRKCVLRMPCCEAGCFLQKRYEYSSTLGYRQSFVSIVGSKEPISAETGQASTKEARAPRLLCYTCEAAAT